MKVPSYLGRSRHWLAGDEEGHLQLRCLARPVRPPPIISHPESSSLPNGRGKKNEVFLSVEKGLDSIQTKRNYKEGPPAAAKYPPNTQQINTTNPEVLEREKHTPLVFSYFTAVLSCAAMKTFCINCSNAEPWGSVSSVHRFWFIFFLKMGFHFTAQAGLEFVVTLLPQLPKYRDSGMSLYTKFRLKFFFGTDGHQVKPGPVPCQKTKQTNKHRKATLRASMNSSRAVPKE